MPERPALPFRVLQQGLKMASRASSAVVERVMRADVHLGPVNLGANAGKRTGQTTGPVRVIFNGQEVRADAGITLLDAARRNNIDLRSYCGGNCSCGTCRLEVVKGQKNLSRREGLEEMVLGPDFVQKGQRLACQAQVFGDVEVRIPTHF